MFDMLWHWISEPLSFPFMQKALVTALLVSGVCAILSCFLVLKGWSLMGDAISHAILPGVVLAFILGLPLAIGAFFSGLFCAIATGYLKENSRLKEDTVMGIVFSGMFALGVVMFTKIDTHHHLMHVLFGDVLGVTDQEFLITLIISVITFLIMVIWRKDFLLYCFDPVQAAVVGLSVKTLHYSLLVLLALTIIAAMQVVGVILVVALLIAPGITAYCLTKRFHWMLVISLVSALSSSFLGVILSFHINSSTGPTIILVQALLFIGVLFINSFRQYCSNLLVES